jgi:hypothetical protein
MPTPCLSRPGPSSERVAPTPHYDGVIAGGNEAAIIALFGIGPVDFQLVAAHEPGWRRVS